MKLHYRHRTEVWIPNSMSYTVNDGLFKGTATELDTSYKWDAKMSALNLNLEAGIYNKIAVRMKADTLYDSGTDMKFYFITQNDTVWNENKSCKISLTASDVKNSDEYIFDFSEVNGWSGIITGLRFDPISGGGSFEIDYIRLIRNENGVQQKLYNESSFEIINGDAENVKLSGAFYSGNAEVSIIPDPDNSANHVYRVISKPGKNWTYIRQRVRYTNNISYVVSFDVKHLGTVNGDTDISGGITVNAVYLDDGGKKDHVIKRCEVKPSDGWVKCSLEFTIQNSSDNHSFDEFTAYAEPCNDLGCNFLIDNIEVTEQK